MRRRHLIAIALAGAVTLAGCGETANTRAQDGRGGATVLNVGMPNGPQTENHNPFLTTSPPRRPPRSATAGRSTNR